MTSGPEEGDTGSKVCERKVRRREYFGEGEKDLFSNVSVFKKPSSSIGP